MKEQLRIALTSKYQAQKDEALATLEVYYNNPAGIGEHPQIVDEMSKLVEKLESAESCIEILNKY
jgi:methylaspartate ammonia-lyase